MDYISEIYEDVASDIWADEIRKMKIYELGDLIEEKTKLLRTLNSKDISYQKLVFKIMGLRMRRSILKRKLHP